MMLLLSTTVHQSITTTVVMVASQLFLNAPSARAMFSYLTARSIAQCCNVSIVTMRPCRTTFTLLILGIQVVIPYKLHNHVTAHTLNADT